MAADAKINQSNGRPKQPTERKPATPADQTDENIFLFIPNLIGMSVHSMQLP